MSKLKDILPEDIDINWPNQAFVIYGQMTTLNDYTNANRANRYAGAKIKKIMTQLVIDSARNLQPVRYPQFIDYTWYISSRHDLDNIAFAQKFVQDGLVEAEILPNDNQAWVIGFAHSFVRVDKGEERVVVQLANAL